MLINRLLKRQKGAGGQEADATLAALDPWLVLYDDLVFGRQIGKGNFGRVFEGTYFGTPVAIKHLFPVGEGLSVEQTRKYVDREIMLLKSLHHPHIVQLIGICDHESGQYIITELVTGGDLKTALARRDSVLSWRQRVVLARDVAYAMNFLHHKGYIHRDLKPDNVLITEHGRAKVCDLGFARASKKASSYMTIAGSDDYMAPEVLMGEKYDEKCDVFGYGAVLAGIVSRRRPKRNEDGLYGFKLDQFKALIPPDCPKKLSDLVLQCCDYDGTKRPSFDQILSTLAKLLDKELKHEPDAGGGDPEATTNELRPTLKMLMRSQPQRSMNLSSPPSSPVSTSSAPSTPLQHQQKLLKMPGMRSMAKDAGLWNQFQSVDSLSPVKGGGNSSKLMSQSLSTTSASVASVDSRCSVAPGSGGGGGNRERSGSDKSIESSPRNRGLGADLAHRQRSSSEKAMDTTTTNSGGGGGGGSGGSGSSSGGGESAMESSGCSSGGVGRRSARSGLQSLWSMGNTGTATGSDRSMGWTDSERSISSGTSGLSSAGDKSETDDSERERERSSSKRAKRRDKKNKTGKASKKATTATTAVGGGSGVHSVRQLPTKEMMTWIGTSSNSIGLRSATWVAEPSEATVEGEDEEEKEKEKAKERAKEKKKKDASSGSSAAAVDSADDQHHLRPAAGKSSSRVRAKTKEKEKEKEKEADKGSRTRKDKGEKEKEKRKSESEDTATRKAKGSKVRKSEAEASPASPAPSKPKSPMPGDIDAKPQWVIVEPHHPTATAGGRERRKDLTALALTNATAAATADKQRPQSARRAVEPADRRSVIVIGRTTATATTSNSRGGSDDVSSLVTTATSGGGSRGGSGATQRSLSRRSLSPRVMARMVEREEWEGGDDLSSDEMDSVIAQYVACPNSYAFGASTMQFFGNLKKGGRVQTLISLFQESEQAAATATAETTKELAATEVGHAAAAVAGGDDAGGTDQEVSSSEKRRRQEMSSEQQQKASAKESGDEESVATTAMTEEMGATPTAAAAERDCHSQPPPRGKDRKEDIAAVPATAPFE